MAAEPAPFIRPYEPSDFDRAALICRATLPPSLAASPSATIAAPYLWTHQYTLLSPSTCFILDDGTGLAVGYVVGCPNLDAFIAAYPRYQAEVLSAHEDEIGPRPTAIRDLPWFEPGTEVVSGACLRQQAWEPALLFGGGGADALKVLAGEYKATMHIDLLGPYQGKGWGRKLIARFVESLKTDAEKGGKRKEEVLGRGVHIVVGGENGKVVGFYNRVGFRVVEGGENFGTIWLVKDVE